MMIKATFNTF